MTDDSPEIQSSDPEGDRLLELTELYMQKLKLGEADPRPLLEANPDVPELKARLELVRQLFAARGSSRAEAERTVRDDWDGESEVSLSMLADEELVDLDCPNCGVKINLIQDVPVHEVVCYSCGSSISVNGSGRTATAFQAIGSTIGRFEIRSQLGRGSFGNVYRAFDSVLDREVAIKVPRSRHFSTQKHRRAILQEAKSTANLRHEHIVQVFEVLEVDGLPVLVNELIDGITLEDLMQRQRTDVRTGVQLMVQVAHAIEYAHSRRVIHRDIKPSNILLGQELKPFVGDFGLAREGEYDFSVTSDGEVVGTPAYMSPEQAKGENQKVDARSDVYSLGVVLYQLLVGDLPFKGNRKILTHQLINEEPPTIRQSDPSLPRELDVIVAKTMKKEQDERYSSAKALADDLQRWLDDRPIMAQSATTWERFSKWHRRQPAMVYLTAVSCLLLLTSVVLGAAYWWQPSPDEVAPQVSSNQAASQKVLELGLKADQEQQELAAIAHFSWLVENAPEEPIHTERLRWFLKQQPRLVQVVDSKSAIKQLNVSPTGNHWAAILASNQVLLQTMDGQQVSQFDLEPGNLQCEFSPDGNYLILLSADQVQVRDVATGKQRRQIQQSSPITTFGIDPAGNLLTGDTEGKLKLLRLDDLTESELTTAGKQVAAITYGAEGNQFVTASFTEDSKGTQIEIWDANALTVTSAWQYPARVNRILIDAADQRIAVTSESNRLAVFDREGQLLWEDAVLDTYPLRLDQQEGKLLVGTQRQMHFYDWESGTEVAPVWRFPGLAVQVEPDAQRRRVALGLGNGQVQIAWLNNGLRCTSLLPTGNADASVRFLPDGRRFVTGGSDGVVKVWDLAGLRPDIPLLEHEGDLVKVKVSADSQRAMTIANKSAQLWNTQTGNPVGQKMGDDGMIGDGVFADNDKLVVTGGESQTLRIWDAFTAEPVGEPAVVSFPVFTLASDRKNRLAVGGAKKFLLFDLPQRKVLHEYVDARRVTDIDYSEAADRFAANSRHQGSVHVSAADGSSVQVLPHEDQLEHSVWSHDGKWLATTGGSTSATLWRLSDLSEPAQELGWGTNIKSAAFGPDDRRLLLTDSKGNVRMYRRTGDEDLFQLQWRSQFEGHVLHDGQFSKDGRLVAVCGGRPQDPFDRLRWDGLARILDAESGQPVSPNLAHDGRALRLKFGSNFLIVAGQTGAAQIWPLKQHPLTRLEDEQVLRSYAMALSGWAIQESGERTRAPAADQADAFQDVVQQAPGLVRCTREEIDRWEQTVQNRQQRFAPKKPSR